MVTTSLGTVGPISQLGLRNTYAPFIKQTLAAINHTHIMGFPLQLQISQLLPASSPSKLCSPFFVFNLLPKALCMRFPVPQSRYHSTDAGIRVKGVSALTALRSVQIRCIAQEGIHEDSELVKDKSVSVVLLAGGMGKRMGVSMPKQYLPLLGRPIALYSLYTLSELSEVKEVIVVCDPFYRDVFEDAREEIQVDIKFALPGKERQDSVFSGLQEVDENSELVCIHDSARPLVSSEDVKKVLKDGWLNGAAVLGVPCKATIKEANNDLFVVKTLDRRILWEVQTPQVIKTGLLRTGFELVIKEGLKVTDDVSIVEHMKHPVYITEGSYTNIKVTTPDDLLLAERIINMET